MNTQAGYRVAAPSAGGQLAWLLCRFARNKAAVVGLVVVAAFVLIAVLAPLIAPYDPIKTDWGMIRKAPSAAHWFGTDELGRDVLSRVIHGTRISISVAVLSVLLGRPR